MVHVILDTNIYGKLFEDSERRNILEGIKQDPDFIVLNFRIVRNELRKAPKILPVHDGLVSKRIILESTQIRNLAQSYFKRYKMLGGNQGQKKMMNDFKIVACATLKGCDSIYTDDERTMKHPKAREAYDSINMQRKLRTPNFWSYRTLRNRFIRNG